MKTTQPRRAFLKTASATGAMLGLGDFGFLSRLPRILAADLKLEAAFVRFRPEIEPLVRLLEDAPRERLLEEVAARIKRGTTYRDVLSAVLLAGVRNIQPRPVGFKFHSVLVVNSAHLASLNSPDTDRWLPIFWALDQFKASQARDVKEGDWALGAVDEKAVRSADRFPQMFTEAMDGWDEAKADVAAAGLARGGGRQAIFDRFCFYGARHFHNLGHKAIYVANSWRTLQTIGWQHAEPVLRSLAFALLTHESSATRDAEASAPGRRNMELVAKFRPGWHAGAIDGEATKEMLASLRRDDWARTCDQAVALINRGAAPALIWDAMFASVAELLMRQPGITTLHACTCTNALHYAFQHVADDETRRFLLLQNAAFIPIFRDLARLSGPPGVQVDTFDPVPAVAAGDAAIEEIFSDLGRDRLLASRKALGWLEGGGAAKPFIDAAQRLIYLKGTDSHDYKFSSAALEDYLHLSPALRNRFLAASLFWFKGSSAPENQLVARTRAAFGA